MPAIPAKLYEAFEKIRLGKVEEGTRLFDRVDGFDVVKAIALAELCYFRHDWKRGMLSGRSVSPFHCVSGLHFPCLRVGLCVLPNRRKTL